MAQKVGVSEATVSRVLNGKPGVSASTRETVLTALDVLGYERPTQLRGERARLIGLVLPELQNPIFPALAEVIGGALAQRGFTPVLCTPDGRRPVGGRLRHHAARPARLRRGVRRRPLSTRQAAPHDHYRLLRSRGIPVVLINAAVDGLDLPCVSTDDAAAAGQAFVHLASLGHQRIGLLAGPQDHVPSRRKLAAFIEHTRRSSREGDAEPGPVEHALFSLEGGQAATTRLLRHGITGVICASDVLALGAIRAIRRAGLSVPRRRLGRGVRRFSVHELHRPAADHGQAADRVDGQGRGGPAGEPDGEVPVYPEELLFEPELVVRGSTGPAPATSVA